MVFPSAPLDNVPVRRRIAPANPVVENGPPFRKELALEQTGHVHLGQHVAERQDGLERVDVHLGRRVDIERAELEREAARGVGRERVNGLPIEHG